MKNMRKRKEVSVGKYPHLESKVADFVFICRQLKFPVTRDIIRFRAEQER